MWGAAVRFFLGRRDGYQPSPDEVMLPVEDTYEGLPAKTRGICRWAVERGYDWIFTCDDDTYVRPERLLSSGFEQYDYVGRFRGPSGGYPAPYCSGFGYWLSRRAMQIVAAQPLSKDTADDRWIGNVLLTAGIRGALDERYQVLKCDDSKLPGYKGNREDEMVGNAVHNGGMTGVADHRYVIVASPNGRNTPTATQGPMEGNDVIAACEFEPQEMRRVHTAFKNGLRATPKRVLPEGPLSNVSVLIKTFLRDGYLMRCVAGIERTLPEVHMIIADDGDDTRDKVKLYSRLREVGHVCLWLPKDSGFGAKSNAAIPYFERPYVLIGSDDFDFSDREVRRGIERMANVLDENPEIGIASGRVGNRPYELIFDMDGDWVKARPGYRGSGKTKKGTQYQFCDLTVNYSLIRREVFEKVRWDSDVKIGGGEHGAFFIDVKRAGWKVAVVSGASIKELPSHAEWRHRDYPAFRGRARDPERPCYIRRGINHFITSSGCEMHGATCELLTQ